jgi:hypothetical protein
MLGVATGASYERRYAASSCDETVGCCAADRCTKCHHERAPRGCVGSSREAHRRQTAQCRGTSASMRSLLLAIFMFGLIACAPAQPTSNYDSCGAPAACLGNTTCVPSDASPNGTCSPPCTRNEDCPQPTVSTGARIAYCGAAGRCELVCDTSAAPECPAGMTCVRLRPMGGSEGRCLWP